VNLAWIALRVGEHQDTPVASSSEAFSTVMSVDAVEAMSDITADLSSSSDSSDSAPQEYEEAPEAVFKLCDCGAVSFKVLEYPVCGC
jgi:hypothetical protein